MMQSMMSQDSIYNTLSHGTNPKQIMRAFETYMNPVGPQDYDLPQLIGTKPVQSEFKNDGHYSLKYRTKLSWFPSRHAEFQAKDAPPCTNYSPGRDNHNFVNLKYSVGKDGRFYIPSSKMKLWKQIPVQY